MMLYGWKKIIPTLEDDYVLDTKWKQSKPWLTYNPCKSIRIWTSNDMMCLGHVRAMPTQMSIYVVNAVMSLDLRAIHAIPFAYIQFIIVPRLDDCLR